MRRKNWLGSLAIGLLSLVMFSVGCLPLGAQSFYGAIAGTVTDSSGAVVGRATVTATNLGTNETKTAQTGSSGEYRFVDLIPANYRVEVQSPSFKRFTVQSIAVQVDNTVRVDAQLQVGATTETVEVTTEVPLLQTESGSVSTEVEGQVVQQMPLNGRNAMSLVSLVPGVVAGNYTSGAASFNAGNRTQNGSWDAYQIGGGFTNENVEYLDGSSVNMLQGNTIALIPTQDALQEFRVQSSAPSAEFGRFGGGVIEMTTKSGSNGFHGTVYEYVRNTILNANYFFSKFGGLPKAPFHQNQYGAAIGGPIKKDKAFFFFSWEDFKLRTANPLSTNVPTAAQRSGIFNAKVTDPSGRCPNITYFTANGSPTTANGSVARSVIPTSCFDATSQVMVNYFPLPNSTVNPAFNYVGSPVVGDDTTQYNGRVDYTISERQRIFGRYTYWKLNDIGTNLFNNANNFPTGYAATNNWTHQAVLGDTYTFNPSTIADLRISYVRELFTNPGPGLDQVNLAQFGPAYAALASQVSYKALPSLTFSGNDNLYNMNPISDVQTDHYDNYGLIASVTKIVGNHSLKFGGEGVLRLHNGTGHFTNPDGFSSFSNVTTGDEVASFLLGEFTTDTVQTITPTTTFNYGWGFYGTDTWKATRNLTLNFGLRWELPGGLEEKKDRTTVLLPNTVDPATGLKGAVALVNSSLYAPRSMEPYHYMLFAPRVSFAQSFYGNSVLRGGYAMMYLPPDLPNGVMAFTSPVNAAVTTSSNTSIPTYFQSNPFPNGILEPVGRSNPNFSKNLLGQSVTAPVPENTYPYMQQWNLSVGQQWKGNWSTEIIYAGTKGTHLPMNVAIGLDQVRDSLVTSGALQNMENSVLASNPSTTLAQARQQVIAYAKPLRPYPQFQNYLNAADYSGGSSYNALYLVAQKRFGSAGLVNANYSWSKMITDTDSATGGNSGAGGPGSPQDFYNKRADRSLAGFDVAHRLVVSYVLPLPFGRGQRFANYGGVAGVLVSGWAANGITTLQDGLPLAFTYNNNQLSGNLGTGTQRPNYVPGCQRRTSGSSFQKFQNNNWFNAACFTNPGDFLFGNEPRVDPVLRAQSLTNFDFSLLKTTAIKESTNIQFRAEAFNLFNHPYFNTPGTTVAGSGYNQISSQNNPPSPRLLQLSLRLNF